MDGQWYTTVDKCLRCGGRHEKLYLEKYDPPSREGATLIAMCPERGWAILFIEKREMTGKHQFRLVLEQC